MTPPPVWRWYVAFCWLLAAANFGLAILGLDMIRQPEKFTSEVFDLETIRQIGMLGLGTGIVFIVLNILMTRLPTKPWAWVTHLTNILVPMVFCCPIVICIPLLVAWMRPETKAHFGIEH
jgi:cell division protein FtsW (lipid II flippase)